MNRRLLLILSMCLSYILVSAQTFEPLKKRVCHAHEKHTEMLKNEKYALKQQKIEEHYRSFLKNPTSMRAGEVRTIPVYVHVIYNTSQQNISDAQINSQIDVINKDFSATNADVGNTPSEFASSVADYQIQFELVQITRKSSSRTSWGTNDDMKKSSQGGVDPITPDTHLNMWVCEIGGGILGYAQFPGGAASTDGVVMSPQYFGSSDYGSNFYLSAPFDKGRTTTHEIGHYLNLRHIWGDGNCNADDFVSDTPTAGSANYGCPSYPSKSCNSNGGFTSDMFMNFMDYSDDACMYMFTEGQKARTASIFAPGGSRENLGTLSGGCSLAAPGNLSSSNVGDNGFTLSWNSVSGASNYTVTVGGSSSTVSGTSYTASGLSAGTTYATSVVANCAEGGSGSVSNLSVTTTGQQACANSGDITLNITTDNYASETTWTLTDGSGSTVASGGSGYANNTSYTETFSGLNGQGYTFTINDSYGDGICCSYGNGSYSLTSGNGNTIVSGGNFGSSEATTFCVSNSGGGADTEAPTTPGNLSASNVSTSGFDLSWSASTDNVGVDHYDVTVGSSTTSVSGTSYSATGLSAGTTYNVSVVAVDAAGNSSSAASGTVTTDTNSGGGSTTLMSSSFESGWDGWSDGGSDCFRYSGSRSYGGSYSIRLRDNSGVASSMTSGTHNVSGYSNISIEFYFYPNSMENGEDFWVQYYDGSSWNTVASYARGTSFQNGSFYSATVDISSSSYNFPSNAQFRFRCDASGNNDQIYIDDVTITASNGAKTKGNTIAKLDVLAPNESLIDEIEVDELRAYPNPFNNTLNIESNGGLLEIYNTMGQLIMTRNVEAGKVQLDVASLKNGLYIVRIGEKVIKVVK